MAWLTKAELLRAFQREYPKDLDRTTEGGTLLEYDFDRKKAEALVGVKWENIRADQLQELFDIACFLNPRAFQYFFPAFIRESQVNIEKTNLLVDSLINMLANSGIHWPESLRAAETKVLSENPEIAEAIALINENDLRAWSEKRWRLFTEQQWVVIQKWLRWIAQDERWDVDREVLARALENAEKWREHAKSRSSTGRISSEPP